LTDWVEKGAVPQTLVISTPAGTPTKTGLLCPFPSKTTYVSGDPSQAASYTCGECSTFRFGYGDFHLNVD